MNVSRCYITSLHRKNNFGCPNAENRKYIDVQIPFDNYDRMGWMPLAEAPAEMVYNPEKDCALLKHRTACEVDVRPGEFIIFFPQDVHAPCLGDGNVRKAIIKILA